jgi:UDP-N-acetyl-D-glucosamine dehydrogenase
LTAVREFYETLIDQVVPVSGTREAELTKLLENTFRHVNVALVNELAMFAGDLGIDICEAIDAASTKPFGFMRFTPGPGVGGHCLPIDPSYLSWRVKNTLGHSFRFVELANDINEHMPDYVVRRVWSALNQQGKALKGSRVLLLGLAYKRNTSDARESPAIAVAHRLAAMGADVHAVDPHVRESLGTAIPLVDLSVEELTDADAVVLLSDHDAFDLDLVAAHARYVFDTRARLSGPNVERL